jgi:two-component system chemotaxis sensor kinase CheA
MAEGSGGRGEGTDKARDEFFSEAQELVDGLGRDLLALDQGLKKNQFDPELINDVFRGVHTLKGLSGLFGATRMSGLSHQLEDALDDLRLGRVELTSAVLDLLFQAVSLYTRLLVAEKGEAGEPAQEVEELLVALGQVSGQKPGSPKTTVAQYDLDPGLFGVLTEYEEHRLRTTIQQGLNLYRIRVRFSLTTIDSALDELKATVRPHGEIITYLPTGAGADPETIELEILMASAAALALLQTVIVGTNVAVEEVPRRTSASNRPSLLAPSPAAARVPGEFGGQGQGRAGGDAGAPGDPRGGGREGHGSGGGGSGGGPPAVAGSEPSPSRSIAARPGGSPRGTARGSTTADMSLRSISQTVRVDIRKLDRLMTVVGELAIVKTAITRLTERARGRTTGPREIASELQRLNRAFERGLAQMQGGILEVRMVPLGQAFDKLARIVRQISREHGKEVHLVVTGAETEIDKLIVEELSDPLMHMIRNAIDHGIEAREDRLRVGKPPVGTIALNAFQKGNHVVLEIEDDGAGMDSKAIIAAAVRRGMVTEEESRGLTPRETFAFVFVPGFTTKAVATDLSGRGVGLDVVKTNIAKLGGVVDIASEVGIGTKMTITLPITLAIINVLLVEICGRLFAVPLANVDEAIALDESQVRSIEAREVLSVRGVSLPICRLERLFSLSRERRSNRAFVVIAQVADRRLGLVVDELVGQQDIVIKPLGKSLESVRGFSGATELGDQRVALIFDVAGLIEEVLSPGETRFLSPSPQAQDGFYDGRRKAESRAG